MIATCFLIICSSWTITPVLPWRPRIAFFISTTMVFGVVTIKNGHPAEGHRITVLQRKFPPTPTGNVESSAIKTVCFFSNISWIIWKEIQDNGVLIFLFWQEELEVTTLSLSSLNEMEEENPWGEGRHEDLVAGVRKGWFVCWNNWNRRRDKDFKRSWCHGDGWI